jgi:hypothetical protein
VVWWVPERGTISLRVGLGVDVLVAREISSGEIKEYRGARRSLERLKEIEGDQRGSKRSERIKEIGGDQGDRWGSRRSRRSKFDRRETGVVKWAFCRGHNPPCSLGRWWVLGCAGVTYIWFR